MSVSNGQVENLARIRQEVQRNALYYLRPRRFAPRREVLWVIKGRVRPGG